jgi:hypothetical protein
MRWEDIALVELDEESNSVDSTGIDEDRPGFIRPA